MEPNTEILNPVLYRRLQSRFSAVKIANAGERRITRQGRDAFTDKPKEIVQQHGEQYHVACPFCRDPGQSLSISHMFGQLGRNGQPMFFLACCHHTDCLSLAQNRDRLVDKLNALDERILEARIRPGTERPQAREHLELPPCRSLDLLRERHPACKYLVSHQLDPDRLAHIYGLGYSNNLARLPITRGRIIIPVLEGSQVTGWQAMSIERSRKGASSFGKYLSAPGMATSKLVYNLDRARKYSTGVIVPEPLDVWRFGSMAVSLFGICSEHQRRDLTSAFRHRCLIMVALKSETTVAMAKRFAEQLRERMGDRVVVVRISDHQAWRSASRAELRAIVAEAAAKEGLDVRYKKVEQRAQP